MNRPTNIRRGGGKPKEMTLTQIAAEINTHLKRFEADPKINAEKDYGRGFKLRPFFMSSAWQSGRYVGVRYVSYQGETHLTRADAMRYLRKLDSGFVGRHFEALSDE
jgi:hypothetical protein